MASQRRQVGEVRCSEQKWQRQVETIGEAVTALAGQVPLGCELHLNSETVSSSVSLDELTVILFDCIKAEHESEWNDA